MKEPNSQVGNYAILRASAAQKGVGGMSFLYAHLKEQGAKHCFLGTDDDCDISFINNKGLVCKDEAPG